MNREADYTIKGFLYQFNLTLLKLLDDKEEAEITVEGIVEDIDICKDEKIKAIQCKYHEKKDKFNLSDIYKPVLQMLSHFSENIDKDIEYVLYAYFDGMPNEAKKITEADIMEVLNTENSDYIVKYVAKILPPQEPRIIEIINKNKINTNEKKEVVDYYKLKRNQLDMTIDLKKFIEERFKLVFGKSFEELLTQVKKKLIFEGFTDYDVEELFYPNAIQKIADLSIKHDANKRKITKSKFINELKETKKTAISRWTKELLTYNKLLKKRREQLKLNLNKNSRLRYIILEKDTLENFDDEVVKFILDYIDKYNNKIKLHKETPLVCINGEEEIIPDIEKRLHKMGIEVETGIRGNEFFEKTFLREPERKEKEDWVEFKLRLCQYNDSSMRAINNKKCNDLFIIGGKDYEEIDRRDIEIERLEVNNFKELKFLLNLNSILE